VRLAGAHGVAVDALGADALAPPALDGVVDPEHEGARGREGAHEQREQEATRGTRRPGGSAQHPMVAAEAPLSRESQDAQDARDGAHAGREDRAEE
jgi:hypothetical protein